MVLIYKENNIKKNSSAFLRILEEKKKNKDIFTMPLKKILEEPQLKNEYDNVNLNEIPGFTNSDMNAIFGLK
jgi:hypothetical protein